MLQNANNILLLEWKMQKLLSIVQIFGASKEHDNKNKRHLKKHIKKTMQKKFDNVGRNVRAMRKGADIVAKGY